MKTIHNRYQDNRQASGKSLTRRDMLISAAGLVGAYSTLTILPRQLYAQTGRVVKKGRIKQAICRGCLRKSGMDIEQMAAMASKMGLVGIDFVGKNDWPTLKKHGLVATIVRGAGSIRKGLNDKSLHAKFLDDFRTNIKDAAEYKWRNVIAMAGDRKGISD